MALKPAPRSLRTLETTSSLVTQWELYELISSGFITKRSKNRTARVRWIKQQGIFHARDDKRAWMQHPRILCAGDTGATKKLKSNQSSFELRGCGVTFPRLDVRRREYVFSSMTGRDLSSRLTNLSSIPVQHFPATIIFAWLCHSLSES
uniref:Uncharacterized protein n=1 Tax=Coccidioides posadasii RMSCC 3488 TaxID=454284 RepID=A0A0J6FQ03_COCPO|nr:hypothetical protein CPAG_08752 [Coccidioides posadasii RMSCC 3488]